METDTLYFDEPVTVAALTEAMQEKFDENPDAVVTDVYFLDPWTVRINFLYPDED